ncbi:major prion protein homolog [Entelurus aequoreus]|uniref:major prion protein homolog n=1 Tax=Entelurus aequoreus TaxID=161455 RepID=UPI002B1D73F6|nr:major prion protein homolog [Entelurus aequoreus]
MKLTSFALLCLILIFFHLSLAKRGGFGKSFGFKKPSTSSRGNSHTNTGNKNNWGSSSEGSYPKQPSQTNQGGYNQHPGRPGSYPYQPSGGGYHNQYPAPGSPYGGSYGGYGYGGGNTRYGGYPGGYINQNPNNPVLNPRYGSNFGYQGQGYGGGSPFPRSVQAMNVMPNDKSRGFGRSAVMAAAGGAVALGYGLGRFPRPHFHFHNPQEEYYNNHYNMYRKYGVRSMDANDYSRDYRYSSPPETYDDFMDSCIKRINILPPATHQNNKPAATTATTLVTSNPVASPGVTNHTGPSNSTLAPLSTNQPQVDVVPPSPKAVSSETGDDTVSIVDIGYPALIEQVKARRCLELYLIYSDKYMTRQTGGTSGLEMPMGKLLIVLTSAFVVLINSST